MNETRKTTSGRDRRPLGPLELGLADGLLLLHGGFAQFVLSFVGHGMWGMGRLGGVGDHKDLWTLDAKAAMLAEAKLSELRRWNALHAPSIINDPM